MALVGRSPPRQKPSCPCVCVFVMYLCIYVCISVCMFVCMLRMYVCEFIYGCMYLWMYVFMYVRDKTQTIRVSRRSRKYFAGYSFGGVKVHEEKRNCAMCASVGK